MRASPTGVRMASLFSRNALSALAVLLAALGARAAFDKLLALSPDMTLVAHWAQAQSLFELVAAVALTGVGQGLTVFAARKETDDGALMREGLAWGLLVSSVAAVALLIVTPALNAALGREVAPAGWIGAAAIFGGLLSTAPSLYACLWQGRLQRGRMLALLLVGWAPMAMGAAGLFGPPDLLRLLTIQIATQGALALALGWPALRAALAAGADGAWLGSPLRRYILAGVSIGVMSPASVVWSRAELAHGLSWHEVAQLQALWRASEWVTGLAGGMLVLIFLPRMAAASSRASFLHELTRTWRLLWAPGAIVLALLWAAQSIVIPILYTPDFLMPATASALFLIGDALRLASWAPLHGLFATERTTAVAIGEWLSLPLFALLLTCLPNPSLELAGACYAFTYVVYLAFNIYCIWRTPARYATPA